MRMRLSAKTVVSKDKQGNVTIWHAPFPYSLEQADKKGIEIERMFLGKSEAERLKKVL